ncbi:MAG TPA: acetyltransferase [Nocardioidaceae bacterium]|nr:acetyltransferase [Nocardioidaceae bacterium]
MTRSVPLVVVGAGGFAREVLDVLDAINASTSGTELFEVVGLAADPPPTDSRLDAYDVPYIGGIDRLAGMPTGVGFVIAIGNGDARRRIDESLEGQGRPSPVLIHPTATRGREVHLGPGTIVCSHVSLTNHISIGRHVHLNLNSTIGHDSTLDDYVTVSPLVAISGNVQIGSGAMIGTGASINQQITIGPGSTIGAGAAVIRDVEPTTTVVGIPARVRA